MSAGQVYRSDASWTASANRSGSKYHWPSADDAALPVCGWFVLDIEYSGRAPEKVPDYQRCRRRACQQRYTAALTEQEPTT